MKYEEVVTSRTLYEQLTTTTASFPDRPAISFQIKSGASDKKATLLWKDFRAQVSQAANMFRRYGIGETDVVAYILPNCLEAPVVLLAGATAGIVNPINPLLDAEQIGAILRETGAKAVVTLAPFPKTEISEKVSKAVAIAQTVKTIFEVDLKQYLSPPTSLLVPLLRPKRVGGHSAKIVDLNKEMAKESAELNFEEAGGDRVCTYFHTGGTTGMPKVAQHRHSGILYNGWCGHSYMFTEEDVLLCPLPMFHVFAAYPVLMSVLSSGAEMVMPTPAGYRGEGVFDNFWKLVERYRVTFMIMVPTAAAALMQRKVDADVSSLRYALCGSAPLPLELFRKFEDATGVKILEGYGMTEATCLVAINPPHGERKVGSVGIPFPYTDVRILMCDGDGLITKNCEKGEIGEICVSNPGVLLGRTYTEERKNKGLYAGNQFLRTGDLGRIDDDGYLWITGRAKDLIIRGGHNIDPALIEEALAAHPAVAVVGAIGQPDAHSGEVPAAYVELTSGASVTEEDLMEYAVAHIGERAAHPKFLKILPELPKTAVGKVFKPDLRKEAISRVYGEALAKAGVDARIDDVREDKALGLIAVLSSDDVIITDEAVNSALGRFQRPWVWAD
ncbi:acyl-CoA synthetase [Algicella marina]|nr:acyl-CoA synthetase [Algicella marina]